MDKLRCIESFVKTVEVGSFTLAAESLGVSQQMVAKNVASLEAHLGATLLRRTTRRQSLTSFGRMYYERGKQILIDIEDADALSQTMINEPKGRLYITAPKTFGNYSLVPFLAKFMHQFQAIQVDLRLTDNQVDLDEEGAEVAFRIGTVRDQSAVARSLSPYGLTLVASPAYLDDRGKPTSLQDLELHDCLGYINRSFTMADTDWPAELTERFFGSQHENRIRINSSEALLTAARQGLGVILAPLVLAEEAIEQGELVRVLPTVPLPTRPIHLLYKHDRYRSQKIKSFVNAALEYFSSSSHS